MGPPGRPQEAGRKPVVGANPISVGANPIREGANPILEGADRILEGADPILEGANPKIKNPKSFFKGVYRKSHPHGWIWLEKLVP